MRNYILTKRNGVVYVVSSDMVRSIYNSIIACKQDDTKTKIIVFTAQKEYVIDISIEKCVRLVNSSGLKMYRLLVKAGMPDIIFQNK